MILLIDESSSVRDTDPEDARVTAATYFVNQLGTYSIDNGGEINIQVATFAQNYTPVTGWIALNNEGLGEVHNAVESLAERDAGWETDYWTALAGAQSTLSDAAAARGEATSCQTIVWFSDGEMWFNPFPPTPNPKGFAPGLAIDSQASADDAWNLAHTDLCRSGGLADQLRTSGIITFGIGLDGADIPPGGFDLMESIVTGSAAGGSTSCGDATDPTPGDFFLASDIDSLLFAFDQMSTPGQRPIVQQRGICQVTVCTAEGHRIVLDASTPLVTILATSDLTGAIVSMQAPSGEIVEIPRDSGTTTVGGADISYEWKSDRSVSIAMNQRDATVWSGLWQLAFTDPSGSSEGKTSQSNIRVEGTLVPVWPAADDTALHTGEVLDDMTVGLRARDGAPADLDVIEGSLEYSAVFRDSEGNAVTILRTTDPASLTQPHPLDLSDAALGAATITLQSKITTAPTTFDGEVVPGTPLEPETITYRVVVLPPLEYPTIGTSVDFGQAESDVVKLSAVLPVTGEGCVRLGGEVSVAAGPADIGTVSIRTSHDGCVPGGLEGLPLELTTENPGNGTLNGSFPVLLEPAGGGDTLTAQVTFTANLLRPIAPLNFWLTLVLALLLGPGIPLGILYLTKWAISTIPPRLLYGFVVDVEINETGVRRDSEPFSIRPTDTASLVRIPPRARRIEIDGIALRTRLGWSPFGRGWVAVDAGEMNSISSATPNTDVSGLHARLPLDIHNHWVLLRAPGAPTGRAQLLVLLGGNDARTIAAFAQTLNDRAPRRLSELTAREAAAGIPVTSHVSDPFGPSAEIAPTPSPFAAAPGSDGTAVSPTPSTSNWWQSVGEADSSIESPDALPRAIDAHNDEPPADQGWTPWK
ncbi:VWA domain-containing protein [Microbacterium sp. NPDC076895]|uniref:VWA domain-containing protein n=1 Tax=Microbacterium sp. NPDC076895 TaxID=3154957 RepID=UPI00343C1284